MDSIGIGANTALSGDVHNMSAPAVLALLLLVGILGFISSRHLRDRGLSAHNLFLEILVRRKSNQIKGFVRSLDLKSMNLVMTEAPNKGETLLFDLSSLPGFPNQGTSVNGVVDAVKRLGSNDKNFLVSVKLIPEQPKDKASSCLQAYLQKLHA
jgi:hypothetical protein